MKKSKTLIKIKKSKLQVAGIIAIVGLLSFGVVVSPLVKADNYQAQIDALKAANSQKEAQKGILGVEADSLSAAINQLQAQINDLQAQIVAKQNQAIELQNQIVAAQAELDKQKALLGGTIKAMYLEGDTTTIEMLASSKNLSDYFDKAQYRTEVQNKVKAALDKVTKLKLDLATQKSTLEKVIAEQQVLKSQLDGQQAEQNRVMALNQSQQADLNNQIKANYSQISELRRQQRAALDAVTGSNGKSLVGSSVTYEHFTGGFNCGGGYPYCGYSLDTWVKDDWGLHLARECVHYVAYKLSTRGVNVVFDRNGSAYEWEGALRGMATINNNPSGALAVYMPIGPLGHVAFVEQDYGNGWVHVSQFNWPEAQYSEMDLKVTPNLLFFHF